MNADKREYNNTDVYSDLSTSYSATYAVPDTQEFTLDSISKKLGAIAPAEDNAAVQANADIMPSSQTQQMSYQRHYQSNTATAKKVSTKAKVACVSYVAVVLLLVLGITLTAVAVSGVFGETLQISANYAEVADKVAALDEQLAQEDYGALAERAEELFFEGYTCAQSVVLAFADVTGVDEGVLRRLSAPFGGGMGRLREVCGAVSGMAMLLGLSRGWDTLDKEEKRKNSASVRAA